MRKYNTLTPVRTALVLCLALIYHPVSAQWYKDCSNDTEPPVAVCEGHTVVSLGADGTAKLYAESVDDGSYDNCEIKEFKIARMNEGWCDWGVVDDTKFRSYTEFCCEDLGHPVWVILRVFDAKHNFNECMAKVTVQDKLPPKIYCPPDKRIACDYWYNPDELYDPHSKLFGSATAKDNCGLEGIHVDVKKSTTCHAGSIKRIFTAVDWGGASSSCTQYIWVGSDGFSKYDITWPKDYSADGCKMVGTDPDDLPRSFDRPRWSDSKCSMIAAAYEDKVFEFVEDVCTKIVRKWTVIDWCQFDPYSPWKKGVWEHTQIIKLRDDNKPEFWVCKDVTIEGFGDKCNGRVVLDPEVSDICTPDDELGYEYKVDKFADGSIEIREHGKPVLDEYLPIGTHKVYWFVDDGCGNLGTCSYYVTVTDGKAPTPVCYAQLSTVVMPQGGMITIWARDFDASSFDNCTPASKLKFSFSSDTKDASMTFDCDHIGVNNLQVWVTDKSHNQAYCNVWLNIGDNAQNCESMNPVSGFVTSHSGQPVAAAEVELYKVMPDNSMLSDRIKKSDGDGFYTTGFGTTSYDRMINAHKDGDPLEGISTLDLLLLQRHITGIEPLSNPYALYAADVDGSGSIGLNDLLILRDAFLSGGRTLLDLDLGWSFFPADCEWNGMEPECTGMVEIDRLDPPADFVDFVGVKKGDINGDILTELRWNRGVEDNSPLVGVRYVKTSAGGELQFVASEDMELEGMQFSIRSEELKGLQITGYIESAIAGLDGAVYHDDNRGLFNLSWTSSALFTVSKGDVLFSAVIAGNKVMDQLEVEAAGVFQNQVYLGSGPRVLDLGWLGNSTIAGSEVGADLGSIQDLKVSPNPMSHTAVISFTSHAPIAGQLDVYTTDMRLVHSRKLEVSRGANTVQLMSEDLTGAGVYYFTLTTGDESSTGKVVVVN